MFHWQIVTVVFDFAAMCINGVQLLMCLCPLVGMTVNSGLLLMAVSAILLPSTLKASGTEKRETDADYGRSSELNLSRFESVFLLACYGFYLVFQLCTHRHLYEDEDEIGGPCANVIIVGALE